MPSSLEIYVFVTLGIQPLQQTIWLRSVLSSVAHELSAKHWPVRETLSSFSSVYMTALRTASSTSAFLGYNSVTIAALFVNITFMFLRCFCSSGMMVFSCRKAVFGRKSVLFRTGAKVDWFAVLFFPQSVNRYHRLRFFSPRVPHMIQLHSWIGSLTATKSGIHIHAKVLLMYFEQRRSFIHSETVFKICVTPTVSYCKQ